MLAVCWHQWWSKGSALGIVVVEVVVAAIDVMVVRGEVVELTLKCGSGNAPEETTNDTEGGPPAVALIEIIILF